MTKARWWWWKHDEDDDDSDDDDLDGCDEIRWISWCKWSYIQPNINSFMAHDMCCVKCVRHMTQIHSSLIRLINNDFNDDDFND